MKTKTQPKGRRLSTAEALHIYSWGDVWTLRRKRNKTSLPCVVVHNLTCPQAKQLARFHNLSWEEKIRRLTEASLPYCGRITVYLSKDQAAALLQVLGHKEKDK